MELILNTYYLILITCNRLHNKDTTWASARDVQ